MRKVGTEIVRVMALVALMLMVQACCNVRTANGGVVEPVSDPVAEPVTAPVGEPEPFPDADGAAGCAEFQEIACCTAMTPECLQCAEKAARARETWESRCGGGAIEPVPDVFDCTQPAPLVPCCRALLPRCTECTARNRSVENAWRQQCEKAE